MKIGELFVQLGVKADTFTVRDFSRAIADIPLAAVGAIASLAGLSFGFVELTKHTLDLANNLGIFRAETGLSTNELQRWQNVAKEVGISGDVVEGSILGISRAMAQLRLGNGQVLLPLGQLGVDPHGKNAFQILDAMIAQSRKRDPALSAQLFSQIGVDPSLMRFGTISAAQRAAAMKNGVTMDERQVEAMAAFQKSLADLNTTIEKGLVGPLTEMAPYMKDIAEALSIVAAGFIRTAGHALGETSRLITAVHKQGGWTNFMNNLANAGATPADLHNLHYIQNTMNVTQHIHTTADGRELVEIAGHHVTRSMTRAMKQFGNGGR